MAQKQTYAGKRKPPAPALVQRGKKALKVVEVDLQSRPGTSRSQQRSKPTAKDQKEKRSARGAQPGAKPQKKAQPASSKQARKAAAQKVGAAAGERTKKTVDTKKSAAAKKPVEALKKSIEVKKVPQAADSAKPTTIVAPTFEILKPFRDAAVKTRMLQKQRAKARKTRGDFLAKPLKKGKRYSIDLRVHTPGSKGFFSTGGIDPAPAWVRLARVKGLDMVAITDFYDVSYIDRIREHAAQSTVTVLPGLDMRCRIGLCDEISLIALFPETHTGADVKQVLDRLNVPEAAYGDPDYVLSAVFAEVLEVVERFGGLVIPSRVDKTPYRHLAIPALVEEFGIHSFDLVHPENPEFFRDRWPSGGFTFFSFSNANALGQIGSRRAAIKLENPGFAGLKERIARRVPGQTPHASSAEMDVAEMTSGERAGGERDHSSGMRDAEATHC